LRTTMRRLGVEDRLGAENIHLSVRGAVRGIADRETMPGG
jgi:SulP family sulfate permease